MANDDNTNSSSIIMANDNNINSMPFNLDESLARNEPPPKKKGNISGLDLETLRRLRTLVSIDYVRVNNVIWDDDDRKIIETRIIEDRDFKPSLLGTVIVSDRWGDNLVYHRYECVLRDVLRLGEPLKRRGPTRPISADDTFIISLVFWALPVPSTHEILKEVAMGEIVWDPNQSSSLYDQTLQHDFFGKYGTVSVGYSVITKALSTTIDVVWMNGPPAKIYGTINAVRSSTTRILFNKPATLTLFDKPANECVNIAIPQQSLFRYPSLPFPVPVDSDLTIEVDLWDKCSSVKQIALGTVHFTPKFGRHMRDIGGVRVSITWE